MSSKTFDTECFGISHIGLIREHNEDVWAAYPENGLFILADGMGGHSAGEIASKDAVEHLSELCFAWHPKSRISTHEIEAFFKDAFVQVNAKIHEKAESSEEFKGMGTTLCSLFLYEQDAVLAHVGDSRIYRFRKKLEQLTEDHSLVSELTALGAMKPSEAETFPYKHILTRAIGTHSKVEPTIHITRIKPKDVFLLCSDGLTNYVTFEQIEETLQTPTPLTLKGRILIELALEHGGGDNITLILVAPRSVESTL